MTSSFFKTVSLPVLLVGGLFITSLQAQHHRGDRMLQHLDQQVELTEEQKAEIKTILEQRQAQAEELRAQGRQDREAMRAIHEETRQQVEAILTPQQQEKLAAAKAERAQRHEQRKPMRDELRAYREKNIQPVLQGERNTFEANLSAAERATLAEFRAQHPRRERGERGPEMHGDHPHKGTRGARPDKEALQPVIDIAKAHKAELEAVHERLASQEANWRADEKAIRDKYESAERSDRSARPDHPHHRGRHGHKAQQGDRSARREEHQQARKAVRFLLLEPQLETVPTLEKQAVSVYPNPASREVTINFSVNQTGPVTVVLIDANGRVLETVFNGEKEAGEHRLQVLLPETIDPKLVVRVTDASGIRSEVIRKQ